MAKNHWILPTHSDVTSKVGLTLAEPPCILDGIPDGGSHGNEKILEDAYQLIVKYSDICSVDVAYLQMILKTCTNTLKNLLSSYSVSPTMLFVVKLRSANFLLNEDCIVLYCTAMYDDSLTDLVIWPQCASQMWKLVSLCSWTTLPSRVTRSTNNRITCSPSLLTTWRCPPRRNCARRSCSVQTDGRTLSVGGKNRRGGERAQHCQMHLVPFRKHIGNGYYTSRSPVV